MSAYICNTCCLIMKQEISNLVYRYVCPNCNAERVPHSAVVFSHDDQEMIEDNMQVDVEAILGDRTVQRVNQACPVCKINYYSMYQFGNRDCKYVCECDRPKYEEIDPSIYKAGLSKTDRASKRTRVEHKSQYHK